MAPAGVDVEIAPLTLPLPEPLLAVRVSLSGLPADVLYAGAAPGLVSGVLQVNALVPEDYRLTGEIVLTLWIGDVMSPTVLIHVRQPEADLSR
jgi:uncharacterized protein (TIGR03437 family)